MTGAFEIAGRPIGRDHPPYVIAELSGNHNGDMARAMRLIEVAKAVGVDAVKLQTYTADTITLDAEGPGFTVEGGLWSGRKLYDLYDEAYTPWEWHAALFDHARKLGITCFSSAFDPKAVDLLEQLGTPAYKIASFEIVDIPLIRYAAQTGKPIIISTGMATADEIADAAFHARGAGAKNIALLHCVSSYPTPPEDANLARIATLAAVHDCPIGLSDHSLGDTVAIASVALGAAIIEKHVTLSRSDGGPDAAFSLEPAELDRLVKGCREAWLSLGHPGQPRSRAESGSIPFRRSLRMSAIRMATKSIGGRAGPGLAQGAPATQRAQVAADRWLSDSGGRHGGSMRTRPDLAGLLRATGRGFFYTRMAADDLPACIGSKIAGPRSRWKLPSNRCSR